MKPLRLVLFWAIDYAAATVVTLVLSYAAVNIFKTLSIAYVSMVFIPLSTLLFSYLYFKKIDAARPLRLEVAGIWVALSLVVDLIIATLIYHQNIVLYLGSPLLLAISGLKFMAVFVGAYLGLKPSKRRAATDMLSPR